MWLLNQNTIIFWHVKITMSNMLPNKELLRRKLQLFWTILCRSSTCSQTQPKHNSITLSLIKSKTELKYHFQAGGRQSRVNTITSRWQGLTQIITIPNSF